MVKEVWKTSALSILPVFAAISATYLLFQYPLPRNPAVWIFYSILTVLSGYLAYRKLGEITRKWSTAAGLIRWISAAALFTSARILGDVTGVADPVSYNRLLTLQFLLELPAMIAGFETGRVLSRK